MRFSRICFRVKFSKIQMNRFCCTFGNVESPYDAELIIIRVLFVSSPANDGHAGKHDANDRRIFSHQVHPLLSMSRWLFVSAWSSICMRWYVDRLYGNSISALEQSKYRGKIFVNISPYHIVVSNSNELECSQIQDLRVSFGSSWISYKRRQTTKCRYKSMFDHPIEHTKIP